MSDFNFGLIIGGLIVGFSITVFLLWYEMHKVERIAKVADMQKRKSKRRQKRGSRMQIVIDLDDLINVFSVALLAATGADYKDVKKCVKELLDETEYMALPEGHGDLKDADAIMSIIKENWQIRPEFVIEHAPTIIEADKEAEKRQQDED